MKKVDGIYIEGREIAVLRRIIYWATKYLSQQGRPLNQEEHDICTLIESEWNDRQQQQKRHQQGLETLQSEQLNTHLVDATQMAQRLGVSPRTIQRKARELGGWKDKGKWLFQVEPPRNPKGYDYGRSKAD